MPHRRTRRFSSDSLRSFCTEVLCRAGLPRADAWVVADSLVFADLRGVGSHGVMRMGIYTKRIEMGLVNKTPVMKVLKEDPCTVAFDGDNGMGQVVGMAGMDKAISLARVSGVGAVTVMNSNHFGACAYYAVRACRNDMIGVALSNAPSTLAPWGGRAPYLGTNPVAIAVPAGKYDHVMLDMAASVVARAKIILAARKGEEIPLGWAIDPSGRPTTDPKAALKGSVLPFGGPKGYGVAFMVEVLAGILSGSDFGKHIGSLYEDFSRPQNLGHFFLAINVGSFMAPEVFRQRMDALIDEIKAVPCADGVRQVLVPGEPEQMSYSEGMERGVALDETVIRDLSALGQAKGIPFPSPLPEPERSCAM
ncbi:MAG: Ldh family oxidoreductase [Bacillota bacterium]